MFGCAVREVSERDPFSSGLDVPAELVENEIGRLCLRSDGLIWVTIVSLRSLERCESSDHCVAYWDEGVSCMVGNSLVIDVRCHWCGFYISWVLVIEHCLDRWPSFLQGNQIGVLEMRYIW